MTPNQLAEQIENGTIGIDGLSLINSERRLIVKALRAYSWVDDPSALAPRTPEGVKHCPSCSPERACWHNQGEPCQKAPPSEKKETALYEEDGMPLPSAIRAPAYYLDKTDWYVYGSLEEAKNRGCIESELTPLYTEDK